MKESEGGVATGIPGLTGLDHFGFTVPDIDEAHAFLVDVLGCEYLYTLGPFQDETGTWMVDHLNVDQLTVMRELRFYSCGGRAVFEVFNYESTGRNVTQPQNSDVGGHHVALYVEDLDEAVAYLRSMSVQILGEPTTSKGPSLGQRWIYFVSPWGMHFELVSYPNGKAFFSPGYIRPDEANSDVG